MPGLVPGIRDFQMDAKTWMAGTSPAMTAGCGDPSVQCSCTKRKRRPAPAKAAAREAFFRGLAVVDATLVFYETAPRLAESLAAMAAAFGERRASVARELTKLHEEIRESSLAELAPAFATEPAKGEIVILVHPPAEKPQASAEEVDAFLREALAAMSVRDAAAATADALNVSRKDAYARALQLKQTADE